MEWVYSKHICMVCGQENTHSSWSGGPFGKLCRGLRLLMLSPCWQPGATAGLIQRQSSPKGTSGPNSVGSLPSLMQSSTISCFWVGALQRQGIYTPLNTPSWSAPWTATEGALLRWLSGQDHCFRSWTHLALFLLPQSLADATSTHYQGLFGLF